MTPKQIELLVQACRMAGIDATKISPENPFEKSGGTAGMLQAAVSELDPEQAAKWRVDAGQSLSVATLAELQSGADLSAAAQADLYAHDHRFVAELTKHRADQEAAQMQELEKQAAEMRWRSMLRQTGGDENAAKRRIAAEDAETLRHEEQRKVWASGGLV